ncbi:sulfite exporter TauE/SafE family protein [Georgenia wangjunii]|uniref:sulfite exporter TauE/SafE family protein n=1 Tax=Georgenia wangjunii TaxID=3117730 RepID=UPI002F26B793
MTGASAGAPAGPSRGLTARLAVAGVATGVLSGLLGVGGGVVLVPLLVLAFGFAQKRAQATSLVAIVLTAASGAIAYVVGGEVVLLPALAIVVGGLAGTFVGGALVHRMSEAQVRTVFAFIMVAVAVRMAWGIEVEGAAEALELDALSFAGYVLAGLAMGTLSGLIGIGGGVVLVPILILVFSFTAHEAQGTSLAVMVPISLMAAWRNSRHGYTDWRSGTWLGLGGILGAPVGATLALVLPGLVLQRIFAVLLVASAVQLVLRARRRRGEPS